MEFKDRVSVARDVIALIAVAIAVLYVIIPPAKRWLDESFAVEAWYYSGDFRIESGVAKFHNSKFYHSLWRDLHGQMTIDGSGDIDAATRLISGTQGDIVYPSDLERTGAMPGRESAEATAKVLTLVHEMACLRVMDTKVITNPVSTQEYPNNVWLQMVKVDCL